MSNDVVVDIPIEEIRAGVRAEIDSDLGGIAAQVFEKAKASTAFKDKTGRLRQSIWIYRSKYKDGGYVVSLVKPQFEAGREKVGKKGVVRDPAVHKEVLEHYLEHAREAGFGVLGLTYSPIRGPEGNIEYLGFLQKGAETTAAFDLDALVEESHQTLKEHGEGTV